MARCVQHDWRTAKLSARQRAMLEFAEKVNARAHEVRPPDLDALRTVGFDDGEILEIVHIVGFFRWFNILADALGVDVERRTP